MGELVGRLAMDTSATVGLATPERTALTDLLVVNLVCIFSHGDSFITLWLGHTLINVHQRHTLKAHIKYQNS